MLRFAVFFLVLALVSGLFGMSGLAGDSIEMANTLFMIFVGLFLVSLITGRRQLV